MVSGAIWFIRYHSANYGVIGLNHKFDIVLDSNLFSAFLKDRMTRSDGALRSEVGKDIYRVFMNISSSEITENYIVVSSLAVIEVMRKFEEISSGKFTRDQFAAFLSEKPEWFLVADLNSELTEKLMEIPADVDADGKRKPVEWADAVHLATAMLRENAKLVATDSKLVALKKVQSLSKYIA
jgi:predicted nucleic acid-binding protein